MAKETTDITNISALSNTHYGVYLMGDIAFSSILEFETCILLPPEHELRENLRNHAPDVEELLSVQRAAAHEFVWWNGRQHLHGSNAHHALIELAVIAKFRDVDSARYALVATLGTHLSMSAPNVAAKEGSTLNPGVYPGILEHIRDGKNPYWALGTPEHPIEICARDVSGMFKDEWLAEGKQRGASVGFETGPTRSAAIGVLVVRLTEAHPITTISIVDDRKMKV